MVDAGMFQGGKKSETKNHLPSGVNLSKLDAVLLTHAHLDHTGRVPLLIKHACSGRIFGTTASIELAELILQDSARLQVYEAERINRTRNFSMQSPAEPLYGREDVFPFRQMPHAVQFRKPVQVAEGVSARWIEAAYPWLGQHRIEYHRKWPAAQSLSSLATSGRSAAPSFATSFVVTYPSQEP